MRDPVHIIVSMTFDVSLEEWDRLGILDRELGVYKELESRGFRLTLITFGDANDLSYQARCGRIKIIPIYKSRVRPKKLWTRLLHSLLVPFFLWTVFRTGSIYRSHQLWGAWILFMPKICFRRPLILRCGYELVSASRDAGANGTRVSLLSFFSRLAFGLADYIVVTSDRMASYLEENLGAKKEKIRKINNCIDVSKFAPQENGARNPRVLFVGRLEPIKNVPLLLEAAKISKIGVDIIGSGSESQTLQEFSRAACLDCRFLENVPNEQLVTFYRQCLAFVLPSFSEWAPKALLEAMAVGAPVIGNNAPGIKEWIEHRRTGLVVNNDPQELARAILQIKQERSMASALGKEARASIVSTFGISSVIRDELLLYGQVTLRNSV